MIHQNPPREVEGFLNTAIFDKFRPWEGIVPAGFFSNFLGTRTRETYWAFPDHVRKIYNTTRHERASKPPIDDNIFDWMVLLQAVVEARDQFAMVAAGAGWGRWLVVAAAAVRQFTQIPYHLVGVEAEPTHFQWMWQHFLDNDIDPAQHRLIKAAASGKSGSAWFYVGRPNAWYGQSIINDKALDSLNKELREITHNGERARLVRTVDIVEITHPYGRIDYLHMDIQGAELDFLARGPEILKRKVKRVLVGTHSHQIEDGLRALFRDLSWHCQFDYAMNSQIEIDDSSVIIGDGVQAWVNPSI